jgi:hypothetical protein
MAKKDKDKDKAKDTGKKKGFLGRIFGGKEGEGGAPGEAPATPEGSVEPMDAPTIYPDDREEGDADARTIPPGRIVPPSDDEADQRTIPPFNRPGTVPAAASPDDPFGDPFAEPEDQRTIPPFARPDVAAAPAPAPASKKWGKAGRAAPEKPPSPPSDPFADEADQRTIPPFDRPDLTPQAPGPRVASTPGDDFSADGMTLAPGTNLDDFVDPGATIPPTHALANPGGGGPRGRKQQDLLVTADPDLSPAPRPQSDDPFAFPPGDDLMGSPAGAPPPPAPASDPWGFGDDVVDLLAPTPGAAPPPPAKAAAAPPRPALPADDPFGAALTDDPFDFGGAKPAQAQPAPGHGKTDEIDVFEVELGADSHRGRGGAAASEGISQDEKTLEMDRPQMPGDHSRAEPARVAPPAAPRRTLFASTVTKPDGTRRLGPPAPEVVVDHERSLVFAPPVAGGWAEVPSFAVLLGDGSIVGSLPRGVRREPDGSMVIPKAPPRRDASLPAGVVVDKVAGVAYGPPDVALELASAAANARMIRMDDGGVLLLFPAGTTWKDDGTYALPPSSPGVAPGRDGSGEALAPHHVVHGAAVLKAAYLGCEEVVYEDGWATLKLPADARVDGDEVVLPAAARQAPGARPALLEVETRPDGSLLLHLPAGWSSEGDLAWVPPSPLGQEPEPEPADDAGFGEPVEVMTYLGIEDSLFANGWTRLDLPPGALVVAGRLRVPSEYAHAGDARVRAQFDRDGDGTLVCDLPREAEVLGSIVLIPPAGESAPRPAAVRLEPQESASALPPGGRDPSVKPKGIASFRTKKSQDAGEADEKKADDKKADEPAAGEKNAEGADAAGTDGDAGEDDGPDEDPGAGSAPEGSIKRGRGKRKKS